MADSSSIRGGYLNPRQAKDGSWYLEGNLGGFIIRVYENKYKRNDKDPSHVWYFSGKPKGQPQARQAQGGQGFQPQVPAVASTQKPYVDHTKGSQGDSAPPGHWDDQDSGGEMPF